MSMITKHLPAYRQAYQEYIDNFKRQKSWSPGNTTDMWQAWTYDVLEQDNWNLLGLEPQMAADLEAYWKELGWAPGPEIDAITTELELANFGQSSEEV